MQTQAITGTDTLRAAIYNRVSTYEQKAYGFGLASQDVDCDGYAASIDATVVARWEDDESGKDWDLPGLNAMLDAAKRGEIDLVICPEPDRLARNMVKQLTIESELRKYGVRLDYARFRLADTAEGRLLKNQLASFAEYEREKIAFRTSRGRRAKAEAGFVVGTGPAPYGYRYTYTPEGTVNGLERDPETAPVLQRIVRDAARMSLHDICRALNAEGVPTPYAVNQERRKRATRTVRPDQRQRGPKTGQWIIVSLRGMLRRSVYTGSLLYLQLSDAPIAIAVPPLVTPAEMEAARTATAARQTGRVRLGKRMRWTTETDPYTLRGLLRCPHCGSQLACLPNCGVRYYACVCAQPHRAKANNKPVCPQPAARADTLEAVAWDTVRRTLLDPEALRASLTAARADRERADQPRRDRLATVDAEIARRRRRLDRATADRLDAEPGSETEASLRRTIAETEKEIARFHAERSELAAEPAAGLSQDEVESLEAFAAEMQAGGDVATPQDQRHIFAILRLRGTVRLAREGEVGIRLGRWLRYFVIDWEARIPLKQPHGGLSLENLNLGCELTYEVVRRFCGR